MSTRTKTMFVFCAAVLAGCGQPAVNGSVVASTPPATSSPSETDSMAPSLVTAACAVVERDYSTLSATLHQYANGGGGALDRVTALRLARAASDLAQFNLTGAWATYANNFEDASNEYLNSGYLAAETAAKAASALDSLHAECPSS